MSFLAPLFLLGALAVGLPVVFHLIRRTTRERNVFSSLMFLLPSPPRLTRRSRLEHLLLLLLRCAALCLLTLGFARPFFRQAVPPPPGNRGQRVLFLVDTSASMRRANLWSDARAKVDALLRSASAQDQFALVTFDRQINPRFTFEQWNVAPAGERTGLLARKLAELSPGWSSTQLGSALVQAAELLSENNGKAAADPARIELITDLQEGSHLEQLQGYEWPKGVQVRAEVLAPRNQGNASLQLISDSEEAEPKGPLTVRVRVSNVAGDKHEQFKVGWSRSPGDGFAAPPVELYVPGGQSRISALPVLPGSASNRILLQGDNEDFDNLVYAIPPEALQLNILYLGADGETDPKGAFYFLSRAFQQTRREVVRVAAHRPGEALSPAEEQSAVMFVVTAPVPPELGSALRAQAMAGKTVLVALSGPEMEASLDGLLGVDGLRLEQGHPDNYAMLGEIDFRHPIFAAFADPRFSDFTKIHFWRYVRLKADSVPHARVVAKFDNGDPAVLEVPAAAGRIILLASGWQPQASQLALSSKFVPLMYSILDSSGIPSVQPAQYRVGDVVPLAALAPSLQPGMAITLPDDSQVTLSSDQTNFTRTDLPGIYSLATAQGPKRFVVNLDASESRTAPLAVDELERLGVPLLHGVDPTHGVEAERKARLQNSELENRQKLWWWFIVVTLIVLLGETLLGGRAMRRGLQVQQPTPG